MKRGLLYICCLLVLWSCNRSKQLDLGNYREGELHMSVDESFAPIIQQHIEMYKETYPNTNFIVEYKPEASCIKDILFDTLKRMVVIARRPTPKEEKYLYDTLGYYAKWDLVAKDAVALIVHKDNPRNKLTIEELKNILSGNDTNHLRKLVFDGMSATATFRYIADSVMKGEPIQMQRVEAGKNSKEVLDYIASNTEAMGFVGVSWIGNPEVQEQVEMLKKIQIVQVALHTDSTYYAPTQMDILFNNYPLVRGLYYVVKENYQGLGSGLAAFLKSERGQLIFRRAYLAPIMELNIRHVKLTD